ncbi:MAG: SMI1/KNR4 family protein [Rhodocyclaceae bacterium]|nr:SMI1/KNR4 family protein [Rhodocyclaceae bacterium]MCA3026021.1 SMI1/KNR4 family protein [Rhodocyclaceae bacterium]MCA3031409.1 SMI1/KNR4 family protein [Rhodocyclaceae bacterium]MCA3036478.1 SMI1/KNR4 family protein [Rhodocyclaceae bacterium]MCA3040962.1 SMI1/KNR4 family protein [Rhodocyclaceae bacterium]
MLLRTLSSFPSFTKLAPKFKLEHVLPPATDVEIAKLEAGLGLTLPDSYKKLLQCARGFWLMGGTVQFGSQHPFVHEFDPYDSLSPAHKAVVKRKGGAWPPPTDCMLCFAEFCMEADGDQVLFDTSKGLVNGEYPVVYYAHEGRPPHVRHLASSFTEFLEGFLQYEAFNREA